MTERDKLIGTIRRYRGTAHVWAAGHRVVLAAVHRGDEVLREDAAIGALLPGDWLEFAPLIESTELGRSLPSRVASTMASRIPRFIAI